MYIDQTRYFFIIYHGHVMTGNDTAIILQKIFLCKIFLLVTFTRKSTENLNFDFVVAISHIYKHIIIIFMLFYLFFI